MKKYSPSQISKLKTYADTMKAKPTKAERVFAKRLARHGILFDSQVVIPPYIVDFLLRGRRLVIELDGDSHSGRENYDAKRAAKLRKQGFEVIRIPNEQVHSFDISSLLTIPMLPEPPQETRIYKPKQKSKTTSKAQKWLNNNKRKQRQIEKRMRY